jgi:hypothetical protein
MNRFRSERGQTMVLTTLFVAALLGIAALVIDLGTWFRNQRDLQAVADAAALAGAQELPESTGLATANANQYANRNNGPNPAITFRSTNMSGRSDTINVKLERPAPGFFAKVFGVNSVQIRANATALASPLGSARYAAPIGVDKKHPLISGPGCSMSLPCFKQQTELDLEKIGPGAFRLLNIDGSHGGTGSKTLADWILNGYDGEMPINWYFSDPGAKFNSSDILSALSERIGEEMLFPVYDDTRKEGANFDYEVIGWIGFVVTSFEARGNGGVLHGYFTRVTWEGLPASSGVEDFGVRVIELIE